MRNLLRSRRGSVAFATVIALVPLIGVVALGAEGGSWYVTKQHAQNAADAAAYSGALRLACQLGASTCADSANTVAYRGKEFAAQNAFCNAGDTSYPGSQCATSLPTGTSQAVTIDIGTYSGGTWTTTASGNAVRAVVSQQQPAYLAAVLGLTTVTIPAQAIAQVENPNPVCGLGLSTSSSPSAIGLKLGGSGALGGTGCGLLSDGTIQFASSVTVTGTGWDAYAVNGCTPASTCSSPGIPHDYYMPSASNPLSGLNSASFTLTTGTTGPCVPSATKCTTYNPGAYNKLTVQGGDTVHFTPGVYSFSGDVNITGGAIDCPTCTCVSSPTATSGTTGVNLVITGSSKLTINNASVILCAGTSYTGTNSALNGVLVDDQATGAVSVGGNAGGGSPVELDGAIYAPKAAVTWSGTSSFASNTCAEVIGFTLDLSGGAYLSANNCVRGTLPDTQVVVLVH
jgi:Flp pilus assembly protein TadG